MGQIDIFLASGNQPGDPNDSRKEQRRLRVATAIGPFREDFS
jgi:hypothetical protein